MGRLFSVLILVFSFTSYLFAHGGCPSVEQPLSRCEMNQTSHSPCDQGGSTSNSSQQNLPSESHEGFHFCGCVGAFVQQIQSPILAVLIVRHYPLHDFSFIQDPTSKRIERPPIRLS